MTKSKQLSNSSSSSSAASTKRKRPSLGGGSGSSSSIVTASNSVQFVPCPAGCGRHIANLDYKMRQHYERECSKLVKQRRNHESSSSSTQEPPPPLQESSSSSFASTPIISKSLEKEALNGAIDSTTMEMTPAQNIADTPTAAAMLTSMTTTPSSNDESPPTLSLPTPSCKSTTNTEEKDVCTQDTTNTGPAEAGARPMVSPEQQQQEKVQQEVKDNRPAILPQSLPSSACTTDAVPNPYTGTNDSKNAKKNKDAPPNNAFAHMMKQSAKVFSSKNKSKGNPAADVQQHFVLEYNVNNDVDPFSWSLHVHPSSSATTDQVTWDPPLWSTTVQVKDIHHDPPKIVALNLLATVRKTNAASNHQNHPRLNNRQHHKWVRAHSRLSPPVLKSMLQKSIRRRKPLPAVRVAMELIDKAWGEFVRRLPIIVLEDATLHPDLPLLVWIMIAHSKGFFTMTDGETEHGNASHHRNPYHPRMIQALQLRVLRIVFQVASCPYHDHPTLYDVDGFEGDENDGHRQPCLSDPFPKQPLPLHPQQNSKQQLQLNIWAMLVRAQYGGMACDVTMLQDFARLWQDRLNDDNDAIAVADGNGGPASQPQGRRHPIPEALASSMLPIPAALASSMMTQGDPTTTLWSDVPLQIHANGLRQSIGRLSSTSDVVLEKLCFGDICKEGVDFHVSNLIDVLLRDDAVVRACRDTMEKMGKSQNSITHEQVLKGAIWKFSAGVNLRRPLVPVSEEGEETGGGGDDDPMQSLWKDSIAPRVTSFQTNYLKGRLR